MAREHDKALIHFMALRGWSYRGSQLTYMFEWEKLHKSYAADHQVYMFEHPTHGVATVFIDEDRASHGYIVGPASEQLGTDLIAYAEGGLRSDED